MPVEPETESIFKGLLKWFPLITIWIEGKLYAYGGKRMIFCTQFRWQRWMLARRTRHGRSEKVHLSVSSAEPFRCAAVSLPIANDVWQIVLHSPTNKDGIHYNNITLALFACSFISHLLYEPLQMRRHMFSFSNNNSKMSRNRRLRMEYACFNNRIYGCHSSKC